MVGKDIMDELRTGIHFTFDYFKATFPLLVNKEEIERSEVARIKEEIMKFLNIDLDDYHEDYAARYRYSFTLGEHILLRLCGPEFANGKPSCYIELKGQGCREFEALNPDKSWDDLLKFFVLDYDANVKRIDIAIDHFDNKPVDFDWVLNKLNQNHFASSFKNRNFNLSGNITEGRSITFGRHGSSLMLCIYEKKKQQEFHEKVIVKEPYWTRYEMRFGNNRADDFAYNYLTISKLDLNTFILSVFYQMLDIKVDNNRDTHHQANVETDPKWLEFLGNVEKYKMVKATNYESTYISYQNWAEPLMGSFMLYLIATNKFELESALTYVLQLAVNVIDDFDKAKLKRINSFLKAKNYPLVKLEDIENMQPILEGVIEDRRLPF